MLKITIKTTDAAARIILEGRLAGPWIEELDRCWQGLIATEKAPVMVDLTGVTFIERDGKTLLNDMWRAGAELLAAGCCTESIVAEITATGRRGASTRDYRRLHQ